MTRIYYYVPEDGDIELQPNVFELSKSIDSVKLKDIKESFPLTGQYIYRFKRSFKSSYVWVDQLNDSDSLPQYNSKIFMKVTRTAGSVQTPRMAPSTPVESSPRAAPQSNMADVKPTPASKSQATTPSPQLQPTQPQPQPPQQQAPSKSAKLSSTNGKVEVKKAPVVVKPEPEIEIDLFSSDMGQKPQSNNGDKGSNDKGDNDGKGMQRGRMNTSELLDIDFSGANPSFAPQAAHSNKKDIFNSNSGKGLGSLDTLF